MRAAVVIAAVLVAACKPTTRTPAPTPPTDAGAGSGAGGPQKPAAPLTGRLSASVSPLTGTITGFSTRTSELGTIVALDADVLFGFDKAVLRPDAQAALRKAADLIGSGGAGAVAVTGFTDAKGGDEYNRDLSRRRAQSVADWLSTQPSIRGREFEVRGEGEADAVAPNVNADGSDNPAGRAKNRRVEIVIPKSEVGLTGGRGSD